MSIISAPANRGKECTRHSIKVDVLNEIVIGEVKKYVKQLTDTKKLLAILDEKQIHFEEALNRDKEIAKLREKEQEYSAMKTSLYADLQEKLITQEQFNRYREIYSNKLSEIAQAIKVQEATVKSVYENGIAAGQWLDEFRENMEIEKLDRMLLISLIDKILMYEDKRVEIVFKYRNEMAKAVDLIKGELDAGTVARNAVAGNEVAPETVGMIEDSAVSDNSTLSLREVS